MLKASGYIIILIFTFIYLLSSSTELTEHLAGQRLSLDSYFGSDKYRYGDLFGMSYLPAYQIPAPKKSIVTPLECTTKSGMHLYTLCDSYLFVSAADSKLYCGADSLFLAKFNYSEKLDIKLDLQKRNVLLIELSERNIRPVLSYKPYSTNLLNTSNYNHTETKPNIVNATLYSKLNGFLFNKSINTNLEMNIWDFTLFTPVKELKAYINYKLFNVIDNNVVISPDKKYLLYKPTIDTTVNTSAFNFIPDTEVASIVEILNSTYNTANKLGFNEIYLAIIPNPVSILYPDYNGMKYNHLLARVQNSPDLKMRVVDIYSTFKNINFPLYLRSDSHWNIDGVHIWLNKFNSMLLNQTKN